MRIRERLRPQRAPRRTPRRKWPTSARGVRPGAARQASAGRRRDGDRQEDEEAGSHDGSVRLGAGRAGSGLEQGWNKAGTWVEQGWNMGRTPGPPRPSPIGVPRGPPGGGAARAASRLLVLQLACFLSRMRSSLICRLAGASGNPLTPRRNARGALGPARARASGVAGVV